VISILLPDLGGGGAERVCIDLAHALAHLNQNVEFVLMNANGALLDEAREHFTVFDLAVPNIRNVNSVLVPYLRTRQPDALIANMWPLTTAAVLGRIMSRWDGRLLLVDHSTLSISYAGRGVIHNLMMRVSMMATYRLADRVAGVSQGVASDIERLAGLKKGEVNVLHNPIPLRPIPVDDARRDAEALWNCGPGERVLTVGSLKNPKNHSLLLRAFARLSRPDSRLMIVGQGQNGLELQVLAEELGVANQVIFAGFHADPSPFYSTADLFVLSSDHEGFGNVIVEALSFGVPVVSTDCPSGPAEILENGRWGRLVPVGDTDALARAIEAALSTPTDREALKRRAANFAPEIAARKYLDLLALS